MYFRYLVPLLRRNSFLVGRICHQRYLKSNSEPPVEDKSAPIKYSTSKAGQWKARYSSAGEDYDDTPKSQSTIMVLSLTVFLVYFCILREENDLDDFLRFAETNVPLAMEEAKIQIEIQERKQKKHDFKDLEAKLQVIRKRKEEVKKTMNPE